MAKRLTNSVITGSDKRLGLYFYYSPHFGHNIIRRTTSLTGNRVKTENAFKGFRESGNRMKQASPIAATLYKLIPGEIRQYRLYRLLTGEALKMLKAGLDTSIIIDSLKRIHIDPLLDTPGKKLSRRENIKVENPHRERGLKSFIRFPDLKPLTRGRFIRRRSHEIPIQNVQVVESKSEIIFSSDQDHIPLTRTNMVLNDPIKNKNFPVTTEEKIPELLYIGRLSECKKLKLYVRSARFPLAGL
jgi:hypothetical protein